MVEELIHCQQLGKEELSCRMRVVMGKPVGPQACLEVEEAVSPFHLLWHLAQEVGVYSGLEEMEAMEPFCFGILFCSNCNTPISLIKKGGEFY